jgi:hypothetical protein
LYAYAESNGTTYGCGKPRRNTHHHVCHRQKIFAHDASFDGGMQQLFHSAEKPGGTMSVTPEGEGVVNVESTENVHHWQRINVTKPERLVPFCLRS